MKDKISDFARVVGDLRLVAGELIDT